MQEKNTIIFLSANPKGSRDGYDRELREMRGALDRSKKRDSFEIKVVTAARTKDLFDALLTNPWGLHICGWGMNTEGLELEEGGLVRPGAFAEIARLTNSLHLVFFSACYSDDLVRATSEHIPFTVGMRDNPAQEVMQIFSIRFYDALFSGRNVEDAFHLGKAGSAMENLSDLDKPLIFKRQELPDDLPSWLGEDTELGHFISSLQPDGVAFLDQINADRRKERRVYRQRIGEQLNTALPLQLLLLPVCPDQKPESFIERMALEWAEEQETTVHFRKRMPENRLHVEKLSDTFTKDRKQTQSYFAELAQLPAAEQFDLLLGPGSRISGMEWLAACFAWEEDGWDEQEVRRYFNWLTGTYFRQLPPTPHMVLIFVVQMRGLHQRSGQNRVINEMTRLAAEFQDRHLRIFLPPDEEEPSAEMVTRQFLPVGLNDLENWLESKGLSRDYAEPLLDRMVSNLKGKEQERYQQEELIDMRRMEQLQRAFYRIHSKRI